MNDPIYNFPVRCERCNAINVSKGKCYRCGGKVR
jgi:rRNA maturation endonuclease Nob1